MFVTCVLPVAVIAPSSDQEHFSEEYCRVEKKMQTDKPKMTLLRFISAYILSVLFCVTINL